MTDKKNTKTKSKTNITQDTFIARLKQSLPPGIGLAEELADVLNVSIDSAYRRIRGETDLTIDEVFILSKKYNISVDEVFGTHNNNVTFTYTKLTDSDKNFDAYLTRLAKHLEIINTFNDKKIVYVAEDIPMFYSFFSKKLSDFKLFYWQRSVLNIPEYQTIKFNWGVVPQKLVEIAHTSFKEYMKIPSSEIWTSETVFTGLRQIKFYVDSGIITKTQATELYAEYRSMIDMVKVNAENARKNISDQSETFLMYSSEVALGTNCIYATTGEIKHSYISFNNLNSLTTNNSEFCEETEHWIRNLEKKSTLISGVSEKERYRFFSKMYQHIDDFIAKLDNND